MNFPIEALQSNLIIKPSAPDEISTGGIIIPDSVKERPNKGTVISMGEDLADKPLKAGDVAYHIKGAGTRIEHENEEYFIIHYRDCLCKEK